MTSRPTPDSWPRFRRHMAWSLLTGLASAIVALWWIEQHGTALNLHLMVALGGGILLSVLLAGALMGLVFVSNRSGHDQQVHDQRDSEDWP